MRRDTIPLSELQVRSFAAWEPGWFLLTAGEWAPDARPQVSEPRKRLLTFNSMTISWGGLGLIWHRPLAIVVVRPQRYTYQFMESFTTFSLCAFGERYRPALDVLGRMSGRDTGKMTDCGLTPIALTQIPCPGFDEADLILECRKAYFHDLNPENFLADFIAPNYNGDYHRMYFGEVLAAQGTPAYRAPHAT